MKTKFFLYPAYFFFAMAPLYLVFSDVVWDSPWDPTTHVTQPHFIIRVMPGATPDFEYLSQAARDIERIDGVTVSIEYDYSIPSWDQAGEYKAFIDSVREWQVGAQ